MKKFNFLVAIPQYMQTQIEAENEEKAEVYSVQTLQMEKL